MECATLIGTMSKPLTIELQFVIDKYTKRSLHIMLTSVSHAVLLYSVAMKV